MRAFSVAVALLLIAVVLPTEAPGVDAAMISVRPFVWFTQNVDASGNPGSPVVSSYSGSPQGDSWICTTTDNSVAPAVDITVDCVPNSATPSFPGECTGVRVGAQTAAGAAPTPTAQRIIDQIISVPPVVYNSLGAPTTMAISGTCGAISTGVSFPTPGADAAAVAAPTSTSFQCVVSVADGAAAAPWNAFCFGA